MKFIKYEPHQNLSPGTVTVTVVCNAESHSGRVATLGVFTWKDDYRVWALSPHRSVKGPVLEWGQQTLRGDTLGAPMMPSRAPDTVDTRSRIRLSCKLCTDGLTLRYEQLAPVLDTLAEHADAWEIELPALRARLSGS